MSEKLKNEVEVARPENSDRPKDLKPPKLPPKKRPAPAAGQPPKPDRTNLWVAVVTVVSVIISGLFSVYQSSLQTERLRDVALAVRDTEDIRNALRKPLEGVWRYELSFNNYFGQGQGYVATGTAILLWEPEQRQYRVYVGYSVSKDWKVQEKLVTALVGGTLQANELGWPSEGFEMPMQYLERTGVAEFSSPLAPTFTLTRGKCEKFEDGKHAKLILAHYENPRSVGEMKMYR